MIKTDRLWDAEKKYYSNVASSLVGRQIYVADADGGALGYTEDGNIIHVAKDHLLFKEIPSKEARMIRFGVSVHETLHQLFTNFKYDKIKMDLLEEAGHFRNDFEKKMYHDLINLVEDPAIENMASRVIGGPALKALDFTIAKIDELSGDFDTGCRYPYEEVFNALVQFGDLGIIHGSFRFQMARRVFQEISPLFYKAMNETDNRKRIDLVFPIYQKCRILWLSYSDSKMKDLVKNLSETKKRRGKSNMNGNGEGRNGTPNETSRKNKKRKATIKKIEEESAKAQTEGETNDNGECKGCDVLIAATKHNPTANKENDTTVPVTGQPNSPQPPSKTDESVPDKTHEIQKVDNATLEDGRNLELDEKLLEPDPVPELTNSDYETLLEQINQANEDVQKTKVDTEAYYSDIPEYSQIQKQAGFEHILAENHYINEVSPTDSKRYEELVSKMEDEIAMLQEELRDIFLNDRSRYLYSDSGKVSMKRFASGKVTTRLFRRKLRSSEKSNMCIGIAGDCSGSMSGVNIIQECLALIALAEIFSAFNIPLYFMGFNVPLNTPVQTHYIRWENTQFERERLLYLRADGSNFDSYSIRYMTQLMAERKEKHKLMFILSDGKPSFCFTDKEGIHQNTLAIQEARQIGIDIIGIGIGAKTKSKEFVEMYGKDTYFHVDQPQDLFDSLASVITTTVNGWI